jgi:hypothetical protein
MFSNNWIFDHELFKDLHDVKLDDEEEFLLFLPAKLRKRRTQNHYTIDDRYNSVFTRLIFSRQKKTMHLYATQQVH